MTDTANEFLDDIEDEYATCSDGNAHIINHLIALARSGVEQGKVLHHIMCWFGDEPIPFPDHSGKTTLVDYASPSRKRFLTTVDKLPKKDVE